MGCLNPGGDNPSGDAKIITLILPRREDASTLYLATQYNIYKSTDGGEDFKSFSHPTLTPGAIPDYSARITSFHVYNYEGNYLR